MTICLRPATMADAERLLNWRNDPETRAASHQSAEISREAHFAWLAAVLENPARKLFVVEVGGVPVGTVRADLTDGVHELSWTVAPEARGRGYAGAMVAALAARVGGPVRAEVKAGNAGSSRVAERAGLMFLYERDGILHYGRGV